MFFFFNSPTFNAYVTVIDNHSRPKCNLEIVLDVNDSLGGKVTLQSPTRVSLMPDQKTILKRYPTRSIPPPTTPMKVAIN